MTPTVQRRRTIMTLQNTDCGHPIPTNATCTRAVLIAAQSPDQQLSACALPGRRTHTREALLASFVRPLQGAYNNKDQQR
jgi:hypothetical protein